MATKPLSKPLKVLSIFLIFVLAFTLIFIDGKTAIADSLPGSKKTMGYWETLPMPPVSDRLQSVHTILLPNGKVLMVNGSSFRSTLVEENGKYSFIEGVDPTNYDAINNTGLFDPKTGEFKRIPSPPALQNGTTNDLFCSGHLQLADGNVLFIGGTGRYYPGGAFTGTKQINLYDWKTETWKNLGEMKDGRWYPSLVPLADGKVVIFSGLKWGGPNQINSSIEIYDPKTKKLHYIDPTTIENSPFNTLVEDEDVYDSIDLYPRVFPLADGRLLMTGDEAGIAGVLVPHLSKNSYLMSIEEGENGELSVSFERGPDREETSKAYGTALQVPNSEDVLLLGGIIGTNSISFGRDGDISGFPGARISSSLQRWVSPENSGEKNGKWEIFPDFLNPARANLQAVILPSKEILVINGGEYPEYKPVYQPLLMTPDETAESGYQTTPLNPAKLPRLYHNGAVLLPDARVLVLGGNANRAAREKDGTLHVDVVGDQTTFFAFAKLKNKSGKPEEFDVETFYNDPQYYYFVEKDREPFVPAEIWQGEIFSPPYLFKPGMRPKILTAPKVLKYGQPGNITVENGTKEASLVLNKLGSITHSFDYGQRLAEMPISVLKEGELVLFTAPENANLYPPGYYMMFYLNDVGKPSRAKIVKLEK
ncbi:galactose oxidase-like domain-containing protein [Limnoraphis robusta]|uniref:Galactose oxidase-like domain-containing protein n=1 Tax=Limnoraphis robusta CCNP1315 TaxID=3110306 RepID=A0ABU5U463_9CYAN|nr:galactose oxidase-like domain-containing protein [Limnoraphis robusta]MEA5498070.1 galactose oxidase-like domain-containing protein [Limnoraphis robusta BA-68 BA1]MEA5521682.1 galactose oxidase-like domain-containing protein [Limnoraphis robusta CCNP1315]MEA5547064.1 galactose oxidase-like domain-containing protein [Limnoraphis robusta CCNP1324]